MDHVPPTDFYANQAEKTNLRWFSYEFANFLFEELTRSPSLKIFRQKMGRTKLVAFCRDSSLAIAQMAKLSDNGPQKALEAEVKKLVATYINSPQPSLYGGVLKAINKAWDLMKHGCTLCNNGCLDKKADITPLFDLLDLNGHLR
jgi:hypothetical protein